MDYIDPSTEGKNLLPHGFLQSRPNIANGEKLENMASPL
jgi:hypothetical protein